VELILKRVAKKVVFNSIYADDSSIVDDGVLKYDDEEIQTEVKSYKAYLRSVHSLEATRNIRTFRLSLLNRKSLISLSSHASPDTKPYIMEYVYAPFGFKSILDMNRFDNGGPDKAVENFRNLYCFELSGENAMRYLIEAFGDIDYGSAWGHFIIGLESSLMRDFARLSAYRPSGFGVGMIPLSEVKAAIDIGIVESLEYISVEDFIDAIYSIDGAYVSYYASKQKSDSDKK